jgi:ribonuclease P protein component
MPNSLGYSRIGFSIGARNVKLASARNRIKRLFREAYRRNRLRISKPCDLVLIARRALPEKAGLADAEAAFMKLIKAAGIAI